MREQQHRKREFQMNEKCLLQAMKSNEKKICISKKNLKKKPVFLGRLW